MTQSQYKTKPLSRKDIRDIAFVLRGIFGQGMNMNLDIIDVLEAGMFNFFGEAYELQIVDRDEMHEYALYLPDIKTIVIREDVYEQALKGNPRHRFTIAHEIGHAVLHNDIRKLARIQGKLPNIKAYENPEWQANEFAGELLAPAHLIADLDVDQIVEQCGVSWSVASHRFNNIRK
ncbi:ImmA/IrrE family metallo-endopeptidase [Exiguobacterium mexicanum]|uniref:ImmA/IrrE family metallo-endopeptidase n=1 Tax=Exiguobacterium mexicanum TaxID=340146 RepID=A0ABT7MPM4_9BACL|nr:MULTISPECIES: ImmA/IrrE family metallo-endopeptidase [Exiguobacterium]MDL5377132.1 ImmA/IrrE family metallo-endopeptidase [Exiguobacterium mexicanum]